MSKAVTILSREDITPESCKWLKLKRTTFEDGQGSVIVWESIERTTKLAEVDGAAVIAKAVSKSAPPQMVVIAQYRVPVESYVLEAPAGLADDGECMEEVAERELKEETGYTGKAVDVSPAVYGEPGIANNSLKVVTVEVDLDDPANANPTAAPETGELIEVFLLPMATLCDSLVSLALERNFIIDSRLYLLAMGVQQGPTLADTPVSPAATPTACAAGGSSTAGMASSTTGTAPGIASTASGIAGTPAGATSTIAPPGSCADTASASTSATEGTSTAGTSVAGGLVLSEKGKAGPNLPARKGKGIKARAANLAAGVTSTAGGSLDVTPAVTPKGLGGVGGVALGGKAKRVVPKGAAGRGKGRRQHATEVVIGEKELMALLNSGQIELADLSQAGVRIVGEDDDGWEEDVPDTAQLGQSAQSNAQAVGRKGGGARMVPLEVEGMEQEGSEGCSGVWRFINGVVAEVDTVVLWAAGGVVALCALSIGLLALKANLRSVSK